MKRLAVVLVLGVLTSPVAAQELNDKSFTNYFKYVVPRPREEEWLAIAWRPSLWDAVVDAHKADKPIVLWLMEGHPLCNV